MTKSRPISLVAAAVAAIALVVGGEAALAQRDPVNRHARAVPAGPDRGLLEELFPGGVRSLDGADNNLSSPDWGRAGTPYARVAAPEYADGVGAMDEGPPARYVSNRVFNDLAQNLFSENGVTHWAFTWGQFLDHTYGLREVGGEDAPIPFDPDDPLEDFSKDFGAIDFARPPAAPGTGVDPAREQLNTVSSYIDAWGVYGGTDERLEWLREGPVDGDLANNRARLVLAPGGYLPRSDSRGNVAEAPSMELQGRLAAAPGSAVVAGDMRANENVPLTSVHTLFAREHNRIVEALPDELPEEVKFQIARRVVGAELQYITYTEFLPAMGVELEAYEGYDPTANASLSNEFAVVGYRAHSMVHGEIEPESEAGAYSTEQLEALAAQGVEVTVDGGQAELAVPLNVAFGNPDLVPLIGLGPILAGLAGEAAYRNDEMIDNQLRSVLFQVPGPGVEDPSECLDGAALPECFTTVLDLGAADIERGRDHGIAAYNDLREAYGLAPKESFVAVTGEDTEKFPEDPAIDAANPLDDPDILDFVRLEDGEGNALTPESDEAEEEAVTGVRRTTLAARLKALYGNVDDLDAFVGMMAEPHVEGSELGELQLAIWKRQFEALRDGDRFFYLNDPGLRAIERLFGIDSRHSLAEVIVMNTELAPGDLQANVFRLDEGGSIRGSATDCPRDGHRRRVTR